MSLDSYKLSREYTFSNPRKEMLREKNQQTRILYDLAMDREDKALLNGEQFNKSPRIFDRKAVDNIHHKITVETLVDSDILECGDYLEFDDMYWLCLHSYKFHNLYYRATFMSCNWKVYWINENGDLKSQFVIDQNSTQYNSGESGNPTITIGAAQHMLKMPCNEDTIMLDSPIRFVIDKNKRKPTCYKITQNDNSAYNYGKGLCCITVTETQLNEVVDKLVTLDDGTQVWVCDYRPSNAPPTLSSNESAVLSTIYGNKNLRVGCPRTYTVAFSDKDGNELSDVDFEWNIVSGFNEKISQNINGNTIKLQVDDEDYADNSFLLGICIDDEINSETTINIAGIFQ